MIICSCNIISDRQLSAVLAKCGRPPRISRIFGLLDGSVQCGRCLHSIKRLVDQLARRAIAPESTECPSGHDSSMPAA